MSTMTATEISDYKTALGVMVARAKDRATKRRFNDGHPSHIDFAEGIAFGLEAAYDLLAKTVTAENVDTQPVDTITRVTAAASPPRPEEQT